VAKRALHVRKHTSTNESRESVGDQVAAEEDGVSLSELTPSVPLRENQECTGQESSLNESQEESSRDHTGEVCGHTRTRRDHAPDEHDDRNVEAWSRDLVDDHV